MRSAFTPILLLLAATFPTLRAQTPYFQQEVNYTIDVTLDDRAHTLTGRIDIEYINRSPSPLSEIWMHLWGNAYKNGRTAYARQELAGGSSEFYFAPDSSRGYFSGLDFSVDGQRAAWTFDDRHPDIAVVRLAQPLPPGGKITLATPFTLKIPASFSRLGHVDQSYQITQWYPKPAVYDRLGWHAMPYLDQGEFYSEFGRFDVSITLPENYVVGATGVLQTAEELEFLNKKERETREKLGSLANSKKDPFPPSASRMKTIRYTAERVHDFGWFADKRFYVLHDTARLADGRTVDCWAMFTNTDAGLWKKGAFYVRRAVEFYSECVGAYPWPQATAVHSALSAGGGMEYPMITVIGNSGSEKELDEVITHEVGHNWFYGILASNERDHPWMDEGLNSYYEDRYMRRYYGAGALADALPAKMFPPLQYGTLQELGLVTYARERRALAPDHRSDLFSNIAYGLQVYMKPALCLRWLELATGRERFDQAMQAYYRQWQFRHPYPNDLRDVWKSAGLDADWFFRAMQTEENTDYALTDVERTGNGYRLTIKNRQALDAPFPVTALKNGQPLRTEWFKPAEDGKTVVEFAAPEADAFAIDYERVTLDLYRHNNSRRTGGPAPGAEPWRPRLLAPLENAQRRTTGILPWLGWNNYDKTMVGLLLYKPLLPPARFQYLLAPGFGLGSGRFAGSGELRYKFFPGGLTPQITAGLSAKTFDYGYNDRDDYYTRFYRLAPSLQAELRSRSFTFSHSLQERTLLIGREYGRYDSTGAYVENDWQYYTIFELQYRGEQRRLPLPFRYAVTLERQDWRDPADRQQNYTRASAEWEQQFYYKPKRKISARFFAGYFLSNTQRESGTVSNDLARASFALNPQAFNDYRFDQTFLGRSETEGFLGRQVSQTEGGFKNAFGAPYAAQIGNSNNLIVSLNLRADLPLRLPIGIPLKPYFDAGYFDDASPLGDARKPEDQWLWSGGVLLELFDGVFEVYFPIVNSASLQRVYDQYDGGKYGRRITWSLRLNELHPEGLLNRFIR